MVGAQESAPKPRTLSPTVQRIFDNIRTMTPEQRILLRERTLRQLDERRANEQRVRTPDQHPLTPPPATRVLGVGGFADFTLDPNLLKYGPFGPNVKYGPLGPIGEEQGAQQGANVQLNSNGAWGLKEGDHPLNGVTPNLGWNQDEFKQRIETATNGIIGAFNQIRQTVAASNQLPVTRPANSSSDLTARATAHPEPSSDPCEDSRTTSPSVRCVDTMAGRLFVRSDPKGFFVGSLYPGEHFRVKAVRYIPEDRNGKLVCYFYGDAFGNVQEKDVWVNCEGLEPRAETAPKPPHAEVNTQYHIPGPLDPNDGIYSTRDYLVDRFASELLLPETSNGGNSKVYAVVKPEIGSTQLYGNYDPRKQNPFVDPLNITISATDPPDKLKVRYVSKDGNYAVVNYDIGTDPKTGKERRRWGVVSTQAIDILRPQP
jgi:hypothetical protein